MFFCPDDCTTSGSYFPFHLPGVLLRILLSPEYCIPRDALSQKVPLRVLRLGLDEGQLAIRGASCGNRLRRRADFREEAMVVANVGAGQGKQAISRVANLGVLSLLMMEKEGGARVGTGGATAASQSIVGNARRRHSWQPIGWEVGPAAGW